MSPARVASIAGHAQMQIHATLAKAYTFTTKTTAHSHVHPAALFSTLRQISVTHVQQTASLARSWLTRLSSASLARSGTTLARADAMSLAVQC